MTVVKPRVPSGFPEYLPAEQLEFNRLLAIIRETYERYGFSPLDTPSLELAEVLLTKGGGETEQQVYRFTKGSNDLMLPFDLTVPLARYVAQHEGQLVFPFRRYQIARVHRGERAQAGRFREFYQCDIDVVGSTSRLVDAELPAVINDIFEQFHFGEFTIQLNNRNILNGFFAELGLSEIAAEVLRVVDRVDKLPGEVYQDELRQLGVQADQLERLLSFTRLTGSNDEVLASLESLGVSNQQFQTGLADLRGLVESLRKLGVPEPRFQINLSVARGLDYYTGTVYETTLDAHPELGSICSGGRYDSLARHYTKTDLPGVGISIGLTRLFYQLKELGLIDSQRVSPAEVVVLPLTDAQLTPAIEAAAAFRQAGLATILHAELQSIKKQLRYADRMGFRWAVLIGEAETASSLVSLKNMQTGESTEVSLADALAAVRVTA